MHAAIRRSIFGVSLVIAGAMPASAELAVSEITQILTKEHGLTEKGLERGATITQFLEASKLLNRALSVRKDEFETTAEFAARRIRESEAALSGMPDRFGFLLRAKSSYDADLSELSVKLPSELPAELPLVRDANGTPVPSVLGARFPEDFLKGTGGSVIKLNLSRERARTVKPDLQWAVIGGWPGKGNRVVSAVTPPAFAFFPVEAILYCATDGSVLHRLPFEFSKTINVFRVGATIDDWLEANMDARRQVLICLGVTHAAGDVSAFVSESLRLKKISAADPISSLATVADLPERTAPRAIKQSRPKFPFEMRRAGIAGEVVVAFTVKTDGSVGDAGVARSSQREFEAAAVKAVSEWRFKPAQFGGVPIEVRMQTPIVFTLNEE